MGIDLALRNLREAEEEEFLRAHRATSPGYPSFLRHYEEGMALRRYLEVLAERERGEHLPPDSVPETFLFAFVSDRIVGRVAIRHHLNAFFEQFGGHIGYVVVPEFRRRGYATAMLGLALQIADEKLGIRRVLVTCDDDNIGSIRTIEKCGGVLENIVTGPDLEVPKRRYWIEPNRDRPDTAVMERPSWDDYFFEIADAVSKRATCDRGKSGCVIVKDRRILVTGFVGSPRGFPHCDDVGHQMKRLIHDDGRITEHCMRTIHAEQNAICQAARLGISLEGATLYTRMTPCRTCAMLIINCGIESVLCERRYQAADEPEAMLLEAGVHLEYKYDEVQRYQDQT